MYRRGVDISTDTGNRAKANSSLDMAIPYCHSGELGEIMERINDLSKELNELTERANKIYAHGYVNISFAPSRNDSEGGSQ